MEQVFEKASEALKSCSEMQSNMLNQESLEEEVIKKCNRQFDQLKSIIDEQKKEAQTTIKNLESVTEYRPPPKDLTKETFAHL